MPTPATVRTPPADGKLRQASLLLAVAIALSGCGGFGAKTAAPVVAVDPNTYPANYRRQIAGFLATTLSDAADFRSALIAPPALKPVGQSQRYVVCLQFNGRNRRREKVVIYLGGALQQYVDANPEQCGDAAYQPYPELMAVAPS